MQIPALRSWLGVLCATLLLAIPGSAQSAAAPATGAEAPDVTTLRAIESQVSALRGLEALAEPDLRLLDHVSLRQYLAAEFERNYLPGERESDQKELSLLGLIGPTDNLVQIQLDLLSDQVVGVYEPDDKSLMVVGDQGPFGPLEKITYAHEFTHALQDQHFDLNTIAPKHPDSNDHSLAVRGLIEGDAIMLQTLWAQANLSPHELAVLVSSSGGSDAGLARAPLAVRSELLFPYTEGLNFVRQAYHQAGNDYAAVDAIFRNPPESTAQILHPEKYRQQVHPVVVQLPDMASQLGTGWRGVSSGVLGELDRRVLLEQWAADHSQAVRVASGWSGDQWQLVDHAGRSAIVLKSTWDSPDAASEFFAVYARGLHARFADATIDESSVSRQALTSPTAATDLRLQGNTVVAVIAFDRDSANAIVNAVAAQSSSIT